MATVIALAGQAAHAMEPKLIEKPTRYNFAHAALMAIVEESAALIIPLDSATVSHRDASIDAKPAVLSRYRSTTLMQSEAVGAPA